MSQLSRTALPFLQPAGPMAGMCGEDRNWLSLHASGSSEIISHAKTACTSWGFPPTLWEDAVFPLHTLGAAGSSWQLQEVSCHNPPQIPLSTSSHVMQSIYIRFSKKKSPGDALLMLWLMVFATKLGHYILEWFLCHSKCRFWLDDTMGEARLFLLL